MANDDLNSFADNLIRQVQQNLANRSTGSSLSRARSMIQSGESTVPLNIIPADNSQSPGLGSRVLDLLMRPSYAVNSGLQEIARGTHNTDIGRPAWEVPEEDRSNILRGIGQGFSGKNKASFSDVLETSGVTNPVAKGVFGLAGDLAFDPLNFVGVPGASKLAAAVKGRKAAVIQSDKDLAAAARANIAETPTPTIIPESALVEVPVTTTGYKNSGDLAPVGKSVQPTFDFDRIFKVGQDGTEIYEAPAFTRPSRYAKSLGKISQGRNASGNVSDRIMASNDLITSGIDANRVASAFDELRNKTRIYPEGQTIENLYKAPDVEGVPASKAFTRTREAFLEWKDKYKGVIEPEDFDYIQRARNYSSFNKRIDQVLQRTLDENSIRTFEGFADRAKVGQVDQQAIDSMMQVTGASSIDEIPAAANAIMSRYANSMKLTQKAKDLGVEKAASIYAKRAEDVKSVIDDAVAKQGKAETEAAVQPLVDSGSATVAANNDLINGAEVAAATPKKVLQSGEYHPREQVNDAMGRSKAATEQFKDFKVKDSKGEHRVFGERLAQLKYDQAVPEMRRLQTEAESIGRFPWISTDPSNAKISRWPIGLADIYEALPEFARKHQFNFKTKLFPSEQQAGVARLFELMSAKNMPFEQKVEQVQQAMSNGARGAVNATSPDLILAGASEIVLGEDKLKAALKAAMIRQKGKDLQDAAVLAKAANEDITRTIADPMIAGSEKAEALINIGDDINKAGDSIGASPAAKTTATAEAAQTAARITEPTQLMAAKTAESVVKARKSDGSKVDISVRHSVQKYGDELAADAEKLLEPTQLADLDVVYASRMDGRVRGLQQFFNSATGLTRNPMREEFRSGSVAASSMASLYNSGLNKIAAEFTPPVRQAAFTMLRQGTELTPDMIKRLDPQIVRAYSEMKPWLDMAVDTGNESQSLMGLMFRNGDSVEEINKSLKEFGISHKFDLKAASNSWEDLSNQWREWDIDDPLEFMQKLYSAGLHINSKRSVTQEFVSQFGVKSAKRPGPEFVKLDTETLSELGSHLDPAMWYPKEAAQRILDLDKFIAAPRSFQGESGALASFVNHVVDPVMSIWKPWVTIARPGHHVRNIIGDLFLTRSDTMIKSSFKDSHRDALKMMAAVGKVKKDPQALAALLKSEDVFAGPAEHLLSLKNTDMSIEQVYRSALKQGILPEYRLGQDLIHDIAEESGKGAEKIRKALTENRWMTALGKASETYSHELRLAHYISLLKSDKFTRQFKTLDETLQAAAERVRRFHPDVTGLTPVEQKYMRRIFPFYSWIRQAIPVVAATMFLRPGRLTELPKAFYNTQIALGQNPDSVAEPFDPAKLYPSFIRDNLTGPIVGTYGVNLGSPVEGVLGDTFNGNPGRNILSMLNPIVKAPTELISGTNMGTGAPIIDKSDYIDSNLPLVNQVASISGYSPSGTLANGITGGGPIPDPQRAVQTGNKRAFWNQNLANFFLGIGIDNYEKPNYGKIAAREIGGTG